MNARAQIIIRGKVQAGGYRYLIEEAAYNHHLTGRVQNQADGTVRIICEGQKRDIQKFRRSIRIRDPWIQVCSMRVRYLPATGEFKYFDVIPDPDPARAAIERAEATTRALRAMALHITGNPDPRIGGNVTILPGLRIGRELVIGAGSVVTKDVPPYAVMVGNPAKKLKDSPQEHRKF